MTTAGIAKFWKPVVNVTDLDEGERLREEIGGVTVRPPGMYPDDDPVLEWAVMHDPFGNELVFCCQRTEGELEQEPVA